MVTIPDNIRSTIVRFLQELTTNGIRIDEAILFGSYAQGTSHDWSDIDLAIVSQDFIGDRFIDRDKIRRIKLKISSDLEPVLYNPKDFSQENPFVKKIIETGIRFAIKT